MVLVLKTKDLNKKLFKKLRAQIVNLLRNSRADPKNGVSYIYIKKNLYKVQYAFIKNCSLYNSDIFCFDKHSNSDTKSSNIKIKVEKERNLFFFWIPLMVLAL